MRIKRPSMIVFVRVISTPANAAKLNCGVNPERINCRTIADDSKKMHWYCNISGLPADYFDRNRRCALGKWYAVKHCIEG
jgi:hypothetical protein